MNKHFKKEERESRRQGRLFIITGPSGVGKDAVVSGLKKIISLEKVITTTTRQKLPGQDRIYNHVSEEKFQEMIKNDELLEWAKVYGHYYGNTKKAVSDALGSSRVVILEVDYQGAKTLKKKFPDAVTIFISPKNLEDLKKRLKSRGRDSQKEIKKRLKIAEEELADLSHYDSVVINEQGKLEKAIGKTLGIIEKST